MTARATSMLLALAVLLPVLLPGTAAAQRLADTLFTWRDYGRSSICRVVALRVPGKEGPQPVFVVQELAENEGASSVTDAGHLAELVARAFGTDPVEATWIFHWGAFSFPGDGERRPRRRKELFLRASFHRTSGRTLGRPNWRLLTPVEVEKATDRLYP